MRNERGVTLIEMLVVVTIIGLFTGLIGVRYFSHVEKAKRTAAATQLNSFNTALASYYAEHSKYPTAQEGLASLRPYLMNEIPLDPWAHPYVYELTPRNEPRVISLGADGVPGGDGNNADMFSWK